MTILKLETLESLISFNKKYAKTLYKKEGQVLPMCVGYNNDNTFRTVIAGNFKNNKEKELWCTVAGYAFLKYNIDKYVVMTESYVLEQKRGNLENLEDVYKEYKSLKDHPDRKEALTIIAVNRYGAKMSSTIIENGTLKEDEINFDTTYKDVGGRMTEILPPVEVVEKYNNSPTIKLLVDEFLKLRLHQIKTEDLNDKEEAHK